MKQSLDLHEINSGLCYLHIIDEFARYSNAVIIKKNYHIWQHLLKIGVYLEPQRDCLVTMEENLSVINFMKCVKGLILKS